MLGGLGACPVKIMFLEVRFLLTKFDSTSAISLNLVFGTEEINYCYENFRGGRGEIWALGGYPSPTPPV